SVNFLRGGCPADEALSALVAMASEGYRDAIARYGVDVLQYGHFTGFAPLRKLIGGFHGVDAQRVVVGNGGMEMISLFFKSLPRHSSPTSSNRGVMRHSSNTCGASTDRAWRP
ncbi:MAG TPA: hypothetical protein VLT88_13430, partial [Desulfosarcina sp.]|nr:hypothetical protein [Desulfosarcina sp.]